MQSAFMNNFLNHTNAGLNCFTTISRPLKIVPLPRVAPLHVPMFPLFFSKVIRVNTFKFVNCFRSNSYIKINHQLGKALTVN
jgi:hypothetical protein